ncbi:MAG TPA: hypothetical protein VE420_09485 [Gemmatimonadales bacterium]|jgi:hypothetical protein|nr:hypothetical protein [Gemmatimonadales bacterium]
MRIGLLLTIVFAAGTTTARAQQPVEWIQPPASSVLFSTVKAIAADTIEPRVEPTHWKRGLVIGGVIGAVGLGGILYAFCEEQSGDTSSGASCIGSGLGGAAIGAVIGGTVGALIGGQFPQRDQAEPAADSTAKPQEAE